MYSCSRYNVPSYFLQMKPSVNRQLWSSLTLSYLAIHLLSKPYSYKHWLNSSLRPACLLELFRRGLHKWVFTAQLSIIFQLLSNVRLIRSLDEFPRPPSARTRSCVYFMRLHSFQLTVIRLSSSIPAPGYSAHKLLLPHLYRPSMPST